jgi:hypothetical protein
LASLTRSPQTLLKMEKIHHEDYRSDYFKATTIT